MNWDPMDLLLRGLILGSYACALWLILFMPLWLAIVALLLLSAATLGWMGLWWKL